MFVHEIVDNNKKVQAMLIFFKTEFLKKKLRSKLVKMMLNTVCGSPEPWSGHLYWAQHSNQRRAESQQISFGW